MVQDLEPNPTNLSELLDATYSDNTDGLDNTAGSPMYVPGISIVKSVPVFNFQLCNSVTFTYTITNQGTPGEDELQNITVTDPDFGGIIAGPPPGDFSGDDGNGILDGGETWTVQVVHNHSQSDIEYGQIGELPAQVTAELVSNPSITVNDDSHPSDHFNDGPTIVDLSACQNPGIGLIKYWDYLDLDLSGCSENFLYSFRVRNIGNISLHNVVLVDQKFGGEVPGPIPGFDTGDDGILSPGEEWQYQGLYSAEFEVIGNILNQAEVTAETVVQNIEVSDLSDNGLQSGTGGTFGSGAGNDDITDLIFDDDTCLDDAARIGLIKEATPTDNDADNCYETILYTFYVQNLGPAPIEYVKLSDVKLGGEITNRTANGNMDEILDPGETWTYEANYDLVQADYDAGFVSNRALVQGALVDAGISLFDYSDDTSYDEHDPTIVQACLTSSMSLVKSVAEFLDQDNNGCDETIRYNFEVSNTGGIDLDDVVLNDNILGGPINGPISDANNDGVLSVGETWNYQALHSITEQNMTDTEIINQAEVTANEKDTNNQVFAMDEITTPLGLGFCAAVSGIQLTKSIGGSGFQDTNNDGCVETLVYTLVVENTGAIPLDNIVLTDAKLGGQINEVPQSNLLGDNDQILAVGETWTYQIPYLLTPDDIDTGSVDNTAEVTANEEGTANEVTDNDTVNTPLGVGFCSAIAIQLTKSIGGSGFQDTNNDGCIETLVYTFVLENTGIVPLDNILLTDIKLGGQITEVPQSSNFGDNDQVLEVGETWTYQVPYLLTPDDIDTGSVDNTADVAAYEEGTANEVTDNDTVNTPLGVGFCSAIAVQLTKSVDSFQDLNGSGCNEIIRYSFTVENTGTVNLDNIVLTDDKIGGQVNNPQGDVGNDQVLSPGEVWAYTADYPLVQNDIDTGSVTNTADVAATEQGTNNNVSDQVQINTDLNGNNACAPAASVQLIKTFMGQSWLDTNNDGCFEMLIYTFIVENTGTIPLENVVLNDPDLGGEITVQPQGDTDNDEVLSVGEIWTYEVPYLITQADMDFGSVSNQANVTAEVENTNNSVTDTDEISLQLDNNFCAAAGIELAKEGVLEDLDGNNCPESIHYTFTVTNTGIVDLSQVVLSDADLTVPISGPLDDTGSDQTLSSGESWTYEAIHPITQADIDGITVTNQASISAIESVTNTTVSDSSEVVNTDVSGACIAEAAIGLIKIAGSELVDVDRNGCPESISYTFTVKNTGAITLEQVVLNDIKLGPGTIQGPLPGNDINGDTFLSVGETWTYQALYPISEQDSIAGEVRNQAQVSAIEQNTMNSITDDSDDNSFEEDEETITSVQGACVARGAIELVKSGVVVDRDGDNCGDSILYTFTVENTGAINLYQIMLEDDLLDQANITGPLSGTDVNNDGILSINEAWTYEAYYSINQQDIDNGEVTNSAIVSALEVISNNSVSNDSGEIILQLVDVCANPANPIDTDFEIFNGITPNGDGVNDYFQIDGLENYPNNILRIFNRWGVLVYEMEGYGTGSSFFRGQSDGRATVAKERELPSGTYFYMLTFMGDNPGEESYSGYLYINRD
ncbi:DUF7507 domain-containing protein [Flagellimonas iocasae]|uniref:Gliding motility-associated C-terminal domain-containing protein n=1 Tax=Flagellimonas iocasae TaxID=2055905 RepID=A0ABW4XT61_9FLAO